MVYPLEIGDVASVNVCKLKFEGFAVFKWHEVHANWVCDGHVSRMVVWLPCAAGGCCTDAAPSSSSAGAVCGVAVCCRLHSHTSLFSATKRAGARNLEPPSPPPLPSSVRILRVCSSVSVVLCLLAASRTTHGP